MSTPNQVLRCIGELQVETTSNLGETKGRIVFVDNNKNTFGSFRVFGQFPFARLILDSYNLSSGVAFRTNARQGAPSEGGINEKFSVSVTNSGLDATYLSLSPAARNPPFITESGQPVFLIQRNSTTDATNLYTSIGEIIQNIFRTGETVYTRFGSSRHALVTGFYSADGTNSSSDNLLFLGYAVNTSATPPRHLIFKPTGNIEIPAQLDVGTINATTYLNLPPVPSTQLLPITLDKITNRVGINKTDPTEALDVTGNVGVSGNLVANQIGATGILADNITTTTIQASTYLNLPPADVLPITLDKTNLKVGINNTNPSYDLDVIGSISATDTVTTKQLNATDVYATNSIYATTYLNLPPPAVPDVLPLTLDKTNNRVGINKTSPTQALDVTGIAKVSDSLILGTDRFIKTVTGTPEGVVVAPVGSLVLRSDGAAGTTLYTKISGSGNVGWTTLSPDLTPITLDKSNNRVGINKPSPTQALDVTGSVKVSNTFILGTDRSILASVSSPEGATSAPVGSLAIRTNGSYGSTLYTKSVGTGNTGWEPVMIKKSIPTVNANEYTSEDFPIKNKFIQILQVSVPTTGILTYMYVDWYIRATRKLTPFNGEMYICISNWEANFLNTGGTNIYPEVTSFPFVTNSYADDNTNGFYPYYYFMDKNKPLLTSASVLDQGYGQRGLGVRLPFIDGRGKLFVHAYMTEIQPAGAFIINPNDIKLEITIV